jgi:hypothetical protein
MEFFTAIAGCKVAASRCQWGKKLRKGKENQHSSFL